MKISTQSSSVLNFKTLFIHKKSHWSYPSIPFPSDFLSISIFQTVPISPLLHTFILSFVLFFHIFTHFVVFLFVLEFQVFSFLILDVGILLGFIRFLCLGLASWSRSRLLIFVTIGVSCRFAGGLVLYYCVQSAVIR